MTDDFLEAVPAEAELTLSRSGLGRLTLRPRRGASLPIRLDLLLQIEEAVQRAEALCEEDRIEALIVETAAPHPALPGYDLDELRLLRDEEIIAWSLEAQRVLRRLELLPVPTIAAIRDDWLGGAAEVALACSYRVSADSASARIGFTQTQLGFIPAWGGTVRLPRLVGLAPAFDLILGGAILQSDQAADIGLVDAVLPVESFADGLERFAGARIDEGRLRQKRKPIRRRIFNETAPGRRLIARRARREHMGAGQASQAMSVAFDLLRDSVGVPLDQAFVRESVAAGKLIVGEDARGRLHSERLTERIARRSPIRTSDFASVGVVGGGAAALDLAHLFLATGAHVLLRVADRVTAQSAAAAVHSRLEWQREREIISRTQAVTRAKRLRTTAGFGGFGTLDLLVAVRSDDEGIADVVAGIEPHVRPECVILFSDWLTSPTDVQAKMSHPERLVGIQTAWPSIQFPLLEIIPGPISAPDTVAAARQIARRLQVTGIVVGSHGTSPLIRLLGTCFAEALDMAAAGVPVDRIDSALEQFGFSLGPFRRIDVMGAVRVLDILNSLSADSERFAPPALLSEMASGRDTFYRYRDQKVEGVNARWKIKENGAGSISRVEICDRIVLALINEAARIVEDGGVGDPTDLEAIAIFGLGFPRERGGVLFFAQEQGLDEAVRRMREHGGPRFDPAGLLLDLAASGRTIFRRAPMAGHGDSAVLE